MNDLQLRPTVFIADRVQPGDIVLTTTPELMSKTIRRVTGSDISHAMICVGQSSVIDSTGDGVHARNLERIILEPGCAGHVLRPLKQLTTEQLHSITAFARAAVGTRYTMSGAAKSVIAGLVAGRRQFCSRLVAQAYRDAGLDLVVDADFCHPGELLKSSALVEVADPLRCLSPDEEADRRESMDHVQAMRSSTNLLLQEARKLSASIESLNDIDIYLVEHAEADAVLVHALQASRYLELWRDELERNSWQYHVAIMEGYNGSDARKRRYCDAVVADDKMGQNRFIMNHAGYVALNAMHPRSYFALMADLYNILTDLNDRRLKAATSWLSRRGLLEVAARTLLRPHTPEWFASLREWNPKQAAMAQAAIQAAGTSDSCSICADEPASDYALLHTPAAGPGTLRLCDDCLRIRCTEEPMTPF